VPEKVFSTLHAMEAAALKLELDCLHVAIEPALRQDVFKVISRFRNKQPSLAEDTVARASIGKELDLAAEAISRAIEQYAVRSAMNEALQMEPKEKVKDERRNARWEYGVNPLPSQSSTEKRQPVTLPGEMKAFRCLLVAKVTKVAPVVRTSWVVPARARGSSKR